MSTYPDHKVAFEELMVVARTEPKLLAVVVAPNVREAYRLLEEFGSAFAPEVTAYIQQGRVKVDKPAGIFGKPGATILFKSLHNPNQFAGPQYGYVLKCFPKSLLAILDSLNNLQLATRLDPQTTKTAVL